MAASRAWSTARATERAPLALVLSLLATVLTLSSGHIAAQAMPTASRPLDISVFGGYVSGTPDYGPYRNSGGAFGLDVARTYHFPIVPALELRENLTNGPALSEHAFLPGIRGTVNVLHVLHPYADFLIGPGDIHFNFNNGGYQGDNSVVFNYGGGLAVDVSHNFQVFGDFQAQHWNFGGTFTIAPTNYLFGAAYHFGSHHVL